MIAQSTTIDQGKQIEMLLTCICDLSPIAQSVLARYPGTAYAALTPYGWRDMDSDGDLDLMVSLIYGLGDGVTSVISGWLENIGYEKPTPPLAADLNQDGDVDGIDLGLLLASWGAQS